MERELEVKKIDQRMRISRLFNRLLKRKIGTALFFMNREARTLGDLASNRLKIQLL